MTRVAFIGLGNMGSGMAANQAKAGREVVGLRPLRRRHGAREASRA